MILLDFVVTVSLFTDFNHTKAFFGCCLNAVDFIFDYICKAWRLLESSINHSHLKLH